MASLWARLGEEFKAHQLFQAGRSLTDQSKAPGLIRDWPLIFGETRRVFWPLSLLAVQQYKANDNLGFQQSMKQMNEIFEYANKDNRKVLLGYDLAIAQIQVRDQAGASLTLGKVRDLQKKLEEQGPQEQLYGKRRSWIHAEHSLALVYLGVGNFEAAEAIINRLLQVRRPPTPPYMYINTVHWVTIALISAHLGDFETLALATKKFDDHIAQHSLHHQSFLQDEKIRIYLEISEILYERGDFKSSQEYLHVAHQLLKGRQPSGDILENSSVDWYWNRVGSLYLLFGNQVAAAKAREHILDKMFSDQSLENIVKFYLRAGDVKSVRALAMELLQKKRKQEFPWELNKIVYQQAKYGDIPGAMVTINELYEGELAKTRQYPWEVQYWLALRAVGKARIVAGDYSKTLQWGRALPRPELRVYALLGVVEGLAELFGNSRLAK